MSESQPPFSDEMLDATAEHALGDADGSKKMPDAVAERIRKALIDAEKVRQEELGKGKDKE